MCEQQISHRGLPRVPFSCSRAKLPSLASSRSMLREVQNVVVVVIIVVVCVLLFWWEVVCFGSIHICFVCPCLYSVFVRAVARGQSICLRVHISVLPYI